VITPDLPDLPQGERPAGGKRIDGGGERDLRHGAAELTGVGVAGERAPVEELDTCE